MPTRACLGAGVARYAFTVTDLHRLPSAGLPAHPSTHDPFETFGFRALISAIGGEADRP
jgi:hypothetical protein